MTNVLSIDQSLSKCACTLWVDGKPTEGFIYKTGSQGVKNKLPSVNYFDTTREQIHYICDHINALAVANNVSVVVFEALSFGSVGNATRDLASLYGAIVERLITTAGICVEDIYEVAPTALKAFGRKKLPEENQYEGLTTAKKPKLVKMDKKLMVMAAMRSGGEQFLTGLRYSGKDAGLDDAADSYLLGLYHKEVLSGI